MKSYLVLYKNTTINTIKKILRMFLIDSIIGESKLYDEVTLEEQDEDFKKEFYNGMLKRFELTEEELYDFLINKNISYLSGEHYYAILMSCVFYMIKCKDTIFDKYRMFIYSDMGGNDERINNITNQDLIDELYENTRINVKPQDSDTNCYDEWCNNIIKCNITNQDLIDSLWGCN